jgi:HAD superfamily hydrolase (TIGR01549 family)
MMRQHSNTTNKIKAIIFDLDGVIIDSLDAWIKVFNDARQYYKLPKIPKKEFIDKIWGGSIERDVKLYFKGKTIEEISRHYFSSIGKFKANTKLNKNVKETLEKLKNKNIKLGLVTNTYKKAALEILGYHKIKNLFDAVVGGDEIKQGKPAPDSLLEVCKRLGIRPNEAFLVGDTHNDAGAAKNANMFFIGYKINGDLKIGDFKDLLELVE